MIHCTRLYFDFNAVAPRRFTDRYTYSDVCAFMRLGCMMYIEVNTKYSTCHFKRHSREFICGTQYTYLETEYTERCIWGGEMLVCWRNSLKLIGRHWQLGSVLALGHITHFISTETSPVSLTPKLS